MRAWGWLWLVCGCLASSGALAAAQATVRAGDRTLTVAFDGPDARVDVSGVSQGYLLLRDERLYSVMRMNGSPMVMDAQAAAGLLGGLAWKPSAEMVGALTALEPTGERQTVAGRAGEVYRVSYRDLEGRERRGQGVLGRQPEVRELTRVLGRIAERLQSATQAPGQGLEEVTRALGDRGLGVLSYGSEFRIETLTVAPLASGYLDLPAAPARLPDDVGQWLRGLGAR
ncbi:hypothetical protein [Castellaniella sp. GW247-6E4]|uniref:hypothetical protein n=1 Tax=Castellaniella sp. GW247-6E4 TaxID=3140380 RepID=UPI003315246A